MFSTGSVDYGVPGTLAIVSARVLVAFRARCDLVARSAGDLGPGRSASMSLLLRTERCQGCACTGRAASSCPEADKRNGLSGKTVASAANEFVPPSALLKRPFANDTGQPDAIGARQAGLRANAPQAAERRDPIGQQRPMQTGDRHDLGRIRIEVSALLQPFSWHSHLDEPMGPKA